MNNRTSASYTMRDVARLAGVSVATVSAVANEKRVVRPAVVARVQEAMKALNYHPDHVARSLRIRKTHTIGVLVPDFTSGFFVDVVRGVEDAARAAGYAVLLSNSNDDPEQEKVHIRALLSRRVDGIVLASSDVYSIGANELRSATPVVLFDRIPNGYRGPAVVINNFEAAYRATQYLLQAGHKDVAFIAGRMDLSTASDRADGFRKALEDAHLALRGEYFRRGNYSAESGYQNGLDLVRLPQPPTAILCSNGPMTLGLLRALQEADIKCPEQISIVGFDEPVPDSYGFSVSTLLRPELTVIAQPGYRVGQQAAEMLANILSEENPREGERSVLMLEAELRVRNSVAPPASTRVKRAGAPLARPTA